MSFPSWRLLPVQLMGVDENVTRVGPVSGVGLVPQRHCSQPASCPRPLSHTESPFVFWVFCGCCHSRGRARISVAGPGSPWPQACVCSFVPVCKFTYPSYLFMCSLPISLSRTEALSDAFSVMTLCSLCWRRFSSITNRAQTNSELSGRQFNFCP